MELRIADTFTSSLSRLTRDEQKAVKTTAFDLQVDPESPGLAIHKLDRARDKRFWSVRVNDDVRIIVHKGEGSLLLCYVDHHDKAYAWAERRKLETHPKTGAAQLVEIRERVEERRAEGTAQRREAQPELPLSGTRAKAAERAEASKTRPKLFVRYSDEALLGYGVPADWLADVNEATEETLFALVEHLPAEAAEALLELATGGTPKKAEVVSADPFLHPDAQRRFRVMANVDELKAALDAPWDRWTVFLHPSQRESVERAWGGPARVSGSAGTGKTIVALHRAVSLARRNPDARVLLTTFSGPLARALDARLRRLIASEPKLGERVEVESIEKVGERLYTTWFRAPKFESGEVERWMAEEAKAMGGHKLTPAFLAAEWREVVDAWQVKSWESYRDVKRLGRKTRLPEAQRKVCWEIFERLDARLDNAGLVTESGMFSAVAERVAAMKHPPYDFAVVDECQDLRVGHLRFLAALGRGEESLFFCGDLGQRIFEQPFSWKALGVDIRGRGKTLTVNYRTSHQIREHADRLLGKVVSDVDGNGEARVAVSVFDGPLPVVAAYAKQEEEVAGVAAWVKGIVVRGVSPGEVAIFVRSDSELERAKAAAAASGVEFRVLDHELETQSDRMSVSTMHLAKGLEFRAVAVMACDDEVIPMQSRIAGIADQADLEEVYNTERHLLYVACTRAREHLLVTSAGPASEFVADLMG